MLPGIIRRQTRAILVTAAVIFLSAVAITFSLTPQYSAQALLLVDTSSKNLLDPDADAASGVTDNSRVEGEVRIVQSDAVLLEAVREGGLVGDAEFQPDTHLSGRLLRWLGASQSVAEDGSHIEGRVLDAFREAVRVRREGLTYLIGVSVTSADPAKAAKLANLVTDVYMKKQVEAKVAGTITARNSLQHRVTEARELLSEYETKLEAFSAAHGGLVGASADAGAVLRLTGVAIDDAGPRVAPDVVTQFYSLQQSAEIARNQYQTLLTRLQDFETQVSLQLADSRVVSPALLPIEPSYPKVPLILAVMALVALAAGIGAGLLREFVIGGFTADDQVNAVLGLPLASVVPHEQGSELERPHGRGLSDIIIASPLSVFSESIRRIRVSIEQTRTGALTFRDDRQQECMVLMVSSAQHGDGKSTLATSVARTYALAGKRTLLIDCDLRKPSIHKHVDREPTSAFIDLLRGEPDPGLANMVLTDQSTNLSVIIGARPAEFPTDDLLMGPTIRTLLGRARRHFDYIVIDTPPVESAVDALYLARLSDAVLFVVRWASTPQSAARRAVAALKENVRDGAAVVAILNGQDRRKLFGFLAR
ncbi:AAA family ATPase [Rhizobium grahamii]|uniref:non-specific protein-tyrosine kinase n=2 Tax=Rhizobium/Agrobacterium group TaxID=227290 RepID=A0A5Q0CEQ4_9HYPH|nr:AAA family ATPase [Rhizobium grahamii]QRM51377.1 AAA family ATPase [Rhizobium sp. BG6]